MKLLDLVERAVEWIMKHWDAIPDDVKVDLKPYCTAEKIPGVKREGHIVVLLVDRQKPSVAVDYSFDRERFGVNRFGDLIWGFDSGCSCPVPWVDHYPGCYDVIPDRKVFKVPWDSFDATDLVNDIVESISLVSKAANGGDREGDYPRRPVKWGKISGS